MYLLIQIRIQILNGENVIRQIPMKVNRRFEDKKSMELYQKDLLAKHRDRIIKRYMAKHPGHEAPTVDILFTFQELFK